MNATVLLGLPVKEKIKAEIQADILANKLSPTLTIVQVGDKEDSNIYIEQKKKFGASLGIVVEHLHFGNDITTPELLSYIEGLNRDTDVNGVIVQLPLPEHLDSELIIQSINPQKDVDGLTLNNISKLLQGSVSGFIPATAMAVMALLDDYHINLAGKHMVMVGRSDLVGKPTALLALARDASVSVIHSKSDNKEEMTKTADVLVVACGKTQMVNKAWIGSKMPVVVDVGINRLNGKLVGDVDFNDVLPFVSAISPVPGGVGPLTVACLFRNVVLATKMQKQNMI